MDNIQLTFVVDPAQGPSLKSPVVAVGDFREDAPGVTVYNETPLSHLYVDLICGRALAPTLLFREILSVEHLVILTIFMDREVALSPKVLEVVSAVEVTKALKEAGLAHIERDLARLFLFLEGYMFGPSLDQKEKIRRLEQSMTWIGGYILHGRLPPMGALPQAPVVLDVGTNGFVLAETPGSFSTAMVELYRQGHLRGALFSPPTEEGRQRVLIFRKSHHLQFDLEAAALQLNQADVRVGQPGTWVVSGNLLRNEEGTFMPRDLLIKILLRV